MSLKVGVIIFGFYKKKVTKPKKIKKKKLKPVQTDQVRFGSVRFGFLRQKLVQIGLARFSSLARFSQFWLGFFLFGSVFRFGSVWARFDFFGFLLIKPKPNRTGHFFQNFNRFFLQFGFFGFIFWFFDFFAHPYLKEYVNPFQGKMYRSTKETFITSKVNVLSH